MRAETDTDGWSVVRVKRKGSRRADYTRAGGLRSKGTLRKVPYELKSDPRTGPAFSNLDMTKAEKMDAPLIARALNEFSKASHDADVSSGARVRLHPRSVTRGA